LCTRTRDNVKKIIDIPLEYIKERIPENLEMVCICGQYGESSLYPHLFEAIEVLKRKNSSTISIYTNGGTHNEDWWKRLADVLRDGTEKNRILFNLDGLKAEHEKYRKGVSFNKVLKNIKAFTDNGGQAVCAMILFKYNEHQIDEVRDLALNKLKCSFFRTRSSWYYDGIYEKPEKIKVIVKSDESLKQKPSARFWCYHELDGEMIMGVDGNFYPCCFVIPRLGRPEHDRLRDFDLLLQREKSILRGELISIEKALNSDLFNYLKNEKPTITKCIEQCKVVKWCIYDIEGNDTSFYPTYEK
jgi:MoaA/NifB/PqqE/SkfB family radical SAM enzyme